MPNFTEKAIKEAFLKLISENPLNKISVKAIVAECGINRNSFYYHFRDIPDLIERIVKEAANALIEKYPSISTLDEAVDVAFNFTLRNRKTVLHICNSVNRSIFEYYLMEICEYIVKTYFETAFKVEKNKINEENTAVMLNFTKCTLFGLYLNWINTGMREDAIEKAKRMIVLCRGLSDEMIERCTI